MTSVRSWLEWMTAKRPVSEWADWRRNEALELIARADQDGSWEALSRHSNGFVREVAVRALSTDASPQALVALVERLNDWVPQVRELAAAGVQPYLTSEHVPSLLHALDPLMALAGQHRIDHGATLVSVRQILQVPQVRAQVLGNFMERQGKAARFLFALLLDTDEPATPLLGNALAHREIVVRCLAVDACRKLPPAQALPLLHAALAQPVARVRVGALQVLLPLLDDPREVLRVALLDASAAVRSLARWEAKRQGIDAGAVLNAALAGSMPTHKREWLGLLGLAIELDQQVPEVWWRSALRSRCSSVRLRAVSMPGDWPLYALLDALDDPCDKVFKGMINRLVKLPWSALGEPLVTRLDSCWQECSPARRLMMLQLLAGWQQLAYLLKRLDNEPVLEAVWLREIAQWCDRQYRIIDPVTPVAERDRLMATLRRLAELNLVDRAAIDRVDG
ncbi:HEAT repeat domain-containing protein [Pseudomonas sp. WOUb67]|uniref:HEAT repeat domain-containing protein n=1 Tax=Pseudomonas sp. WOUb67 TaxID=3161136 RepID=UPI003CF7A5EF